MSAADRKHEPTPSKRAREARLCASLERDDQLRELVRQRLTEDPTLDASDVRIDVRDGRVRLAGTVTSARARREIEQTVENCDAREVDNQLRPLG
jgi:osmotically-inducible protein OsmY